MNMLCILLFTIHIEGKLVILRVVNTIGFTKRNLEISNGQ